MHCTTTTCFIFNPNNFSVFCIFFLNCQSFYYRSNPDKAACATKCEDHVHSKRSVYCVQRDNLFASLQTAIDKLLKSKNKSIRLSAAAYNETFKLLQASHYKYVGHLMCHYLCRQQGFALARSMRGNSHSCSLYSDYMMTLRGLLYNKDTKMFHMIMNKGVSFLVSCMQWHGTTPMRDEILAVGDDMIRRYVVTACENTTQGAMETFSAMFAQLKMVADSEPESKLLIYIETYVQDLSHNFDYLLHDFDYLSQSRAASTTFSTTSPTFSRKFL